MLFTELQWKNDREMDRFIPVSASLSWAKIKGSLARAEDDFLLPLLGDELLTKLNAQNTLVAEADDEDEQKAMVDVLECAKKAVAHLAFFSDFDALNLRITDQGFQRQQSENQTFVSAYKYQEDALRNTFRNRGFNALDRLLSLLMKHIEYYPEFKESPGYGRRTRHIVRSVADVQQVYDINASNIIFLRLLPVFSTVEELTLQPILGNTLYDELKEWLQQGSPENATTNPDDNPGTDGDNNKDNAFFVSLRRQCCAVVVMAAVIRLLRTTGSITDRGMFFSREKAVAGGNMEAEPTADSRLALTVADAERSLKGYTARLVGFVAKHGEHAAGNPIHAYDRESNDEKRAFWA